MRTLHIIMPMAGEGSRFMREGWTVPKPLIMLNGSPLFKHSINSVNSIGVPMKYSFIVRQEHIDNYNIDLEIKRTIPEANVFSVEKTTRGAVETCLLAEPAIKENDGILVMDCDLEFRSGGFESLLKDNLAQPASGAEGGCLVSFESDSPRYSYAEMKDGRVVRTAEKQVISNNALCGAYYFSTGRIFVEAAKRLLSDSSFDKPEFYLSLLYNYLIEKGERVSLAHTDAYFSYGTPEELKRYL